MKLLNPEIASQLPGLYATEEVPPEEKVIVAKFFNPCGAATWYAAEFDGEDIFFGFADLGDPTCAEWGYFSLQELEGYTNQIGLGIERDRWFEPTAFKNITREL